MIKNLNEHIKYSDLKIGQKVTLRNLDWYNYFKDDGSINTFIPSMKKYLNKTTSIISINLKAKFIGLDIDTNRWKYKLEMFEKINIKESKRTLNNQNISNSDLYLGQILEIESFDYLTDESLKLQKMYSEILNLANKKVRISQINENERWVKIEESTLSIHITSFKPICTFDERNIKDNLTSYHKRILNNSICGGVGHTVYKTDYESIFKSSMSKVSLKSKNKIKLLKNY